MLANTNRYNSSIGLHRKEESNSLGTALNAAFKATIELLSEDGRRIRRARQEFSGLKSTTSAVVRADTNRRMTSNLYELRGKAQILTDRSLMPRDIEQPAKTGYWYLVSDMTGDLAVFSPVTLPTNVVIKGEVRCGKNSYSRFMYSHYSEDADFLNTNPSAFQSLLKNLNPNGTRAAFEAAQDSIDEKARNRGK